ncbi:MAG: hypothetical protein HOP06_00340 [Methylotenera sp.]|nr:hypothetical protein [Methylotenera sp.]
MHPLVKILLLVLILSLMNFMNNQSIWVLCGLVCMLAAWLQFSNLVRLVKRMRWLLASIFIIYAFGTPGEYVQWFPMYVSPTYEGCIQGLLQIAKLLIAIASLSMLFSTSSKAHLMAGLYLLLSPLKWLGFNVERFTARLLLTLDYVDELAVDKQFKLSFKHLDTLHENTDNLPANKVIILQQPPFLMVDKLVLCLIVICMITLLAYKALS